MWREKHNKLWVSHEKYFVDKLWENEIVHMLKYNPKIHHRRSIRLKEYDYRRAGAYFITICSWNNECLFGSISDGKIQLNEYGQIVNVEWLQTGVVRPNVKLDTFIVMPNHIHGIIILNEDARTIQPVVGSPRRVAPTGRPNGPVSGSIGAIVGQYKSIVTKRINKMRNTTGFNIWQRNYYEHIIRNENELNRIREYIINNPTRWAEDENNPENINQRKP